MAKKRECYFIEAGSKGIHFPYFKRKHIVAGDYDEICDFDLTGMTKAQIKEGIKENQKEYKKKYGKEANPINQLVDLSQLEEGDMIAVTKGNTRVEEFAIVTRGYYYKPDLKYNIAGKHAPHAHRADVEYLGFGTDKIGSLGVAGIFKDRQGKIAGCFGQKINGGNGSTDPMSATGTGGYAKTLEDDLNLLFYGPPGTGKTFVADNLAEEFVSGNTQTWPDEEKMVQPSDVATMADAAYEQYVITEIQREGKKAGFTWTEKKRNSNYILAKDGKEIRMVIATHRSSTKNDEECWIGVKTDRLSFLSQGISPENELNQYIVIVNCATKNFVVLPFLVEQREARHGSPTQANWTGTATGDHHFKINIGAEEANLITTGVDYPCTKFARNIRSVLFRQFIKRVTFHQSYSYEEFVEGIRPNLDSKELAYKFEDGFFKEICHAAKNDPHNRYVLLIDEINRGKIPAIFGELITLIDDEKRENYELNLTYTKERFSVPKNLFIIGTMNTADQSISQLDIALRRRFSHKELMPDAAKIDEKITHELTADTNSHKKGDKIEISLKLVLEKINEKIRDDAGREKQIGHAYFMKGGKPISDISLLRDRFENKIIPLIQEYHYEDMKSVHKILGDGFIDLSAQTVKIDWTSAALDSPLNATLDTILDKFAVACDDMTKL